MLKEREKLFHQVGLKNVIVLRNIYLGEDTR